MVEFIWVDGVFCYVLFVFGRIRGYLVELGLDGFIDIWCLVFLSKIMYVTLHSPGDALCVIYLSTYLLFIGQFSILKQSRVQRCDGESVIVARYGLRQDLAFVWGHFKIRMIVTAAYGFRREEYFLKYQIHCQIA